MGHVQILRRRTRARRTARAAPLRAGPDRAALRDVLGYAGAQPKLKVGAADDAHEREADAVADRVMAAPEDTLQRSCQDCAEAEDLAQPAAAEPRDPEAIQRKEITAGAAAPAPAATLLGARGHGQPLPAAERAFFEPRLGARLSQVRIHSDTEAQQLSRAFAARAFTLGRDIYFGRGEYRPGTSAGRHLIAHELAHVGQQGAADNTLRRAACPSTSCAGYTNSHCGAYWANAWWLPLAYAHNATLACKETPNHPTARCVRKTLQDRLAATPAPVKSAATAAKPYEFLSPATYRSFVWANLTPHIYADHVHAYRSAGCPGGPAPYAAWLAVSTVPMPPGTVGRSIRYGGGSCSGNWGRWC